jgi:calcineurin-like phosphoesterase family protein
MKFFTADLHFGHEKMALARGFPFCQEHDDYLITQINQIVERTDNLYILGDFGFKPARYRPRIKCKYIHFILGNHDKFLECTKVFGTSHNILSTKVGPNRVYMSHFAMAYWNNSHNGSGHLYGHTHAQRENILDLAFPGRRSMDVGVDNSKRLRNTWAPFEEYDIEQMFKQPGHENACIYPSRNQ